MSIYLNLLHDIPETTQKGILITNLTSILNNTRELEVSIRATTVLADALQIVDKIHTSDNIQYHIASEYVDRNDNGVGVVTNMVVSESIAIMIADKYVPTNETVGFIKVLFKLHSRETIWTC